VAPILYRLGKFCVRRRYVVLGLWAVAVVGLVIASFSAGSQASDNLSLPGTDSQKATDTLNDRFPSQANGTSPIVVHSDTQDLTTGNAKDAVDKAVSAAKGSAIVESVVSPYDQAGAAAVSKDKHTVYLSIALKDPIGDYTIDQVQTLVDKTEAPLDAAKLDNAAGGAIGQKISKSSTESSELIGIIAAIIILLLTFGSAVSMMLPIATAVLGLAGAISLITLLSHVVTVPTVGPTLGVMLGLGVGIDYALFLVSRHRQQLAEGIDVNESVAQAIATTGGAVLFAGTTVVIAICSLALAGIPLVSAMGFTAAIAVVVAIIAALTLLPALLAVLGPRIDSWRIPFLHSDMKLQADHDNSRWARWAHGVADRPWLAMLAALVILIPLAIPTLSLELGQADPSQGPPDAQSTQAYDMLTDGFGEGINGPILVTAQLPGDSTDSATLQTLVTDMGKDSDVASVSPPNVDSDKNAAIISVVPKTGPADDKTTDLVNELRDTTIPAALKGTKVIAYVGGTTAGYIDLADQISDSLPGVIIIVIILSFLVLLLAFRSIAIPVQAAAMNLLGVAASYGVIVAVFQWGWLDSLIGLDGPTPIVSFVPLMMFAILFGLSMDYEVFLISHIEEEYTASGDNRQSVVRGLSASARVITSAALIMVFVFGSFMFSEDPTVKQFGLGLAFAIAIDATVIRCLLVPALMVVMDKANWWLPHWIDRFLPHMSVEGGNFLVTKDASEQRAATGERLEDL
jgi:putative drug exporter of the RND superfamily